MNPHTWRQLSMVHLSDLHFGDRHTFNAAPTPDGAPASPRGRPTLAQSVLADLQTINGEFASSAEAFLDRESSSVPQERAILAFTGDLTERAETPQFESAKQCMQSLANGLGLTMRDVFVVPGNHDVSYVEQAPADRWARYCRFYEDHADARAAGTGQTAMRFRSDAPHALTRIVDQSSMGLIVAEINSCAYVQRGTAGERRGEVDEQAIHELEQALKSINERDRRRSIRIALIHHHPLVLPGLADPNEGYDAVVNADLLLGVLKRFAFHTVLHGHKHTPHTFTYDAVCAWTTDAVRPLMVIAGGSAGSTELRHQPRATNTYNVVRIKWQPDAPQARIHVETRGLITYDDDGRPLPGPRWHWKTLRVDDRLISSSQPQERQVGITRVRGPGDEAFERERSATIEASRRNYPVIEVMPSLDPAQGYEARVWIECQPDKPEYRAPDRVEWSAGRFFPEIHVINSAESPVFEARFSYWGPMLIQARMFWSNGEGSADHEATAYVFAHFPGRGE